MRTFLADLGYALRQFRRAPTLFTVATIIIGVGIASNSATFALIDALFLRELPVSDPGSLVQVVQIRPNLPPESLFQFGFYKQLIDGSRTLRDIVGQLEMTATLTRGDNSERVKVLLVTDSFLSTLVGWPGQIGPKEDGNDNRAYLTHAAWARLFGSDPAIMGRTLVLQGQPFVIAGVTPDQFHGISLETSPDFFIPYTHLRSFTSMESVNEDTSYVEIIARLRPGATVKQAEEDSAAILQTYEQRAGQLLRNARLSVVSLRHGTSQLRNQTRTYLIVVMAGAAFLLLLVCVNVGGLLLARMTARRRETAIRAALGANGFQLARRWVAEAVLLASAGGALGLFLTYLSLPLLRRWISEVQAQSGDMLRSELLLQPSMRVIGAFLLVCLATAILCAVAPAWRISHGDANQPLKSGISERSIGNAHALISAIQIGLSTMLVFHTGLIVRSFSNLNTVRPGFDAGHVVTFSIDPSAKRYTGKELWSLQTRLMERVLALPDVQQSGIAMRGLMRGVGQKKSIVLPGQALSPTAEWNASANVVTPDYFKALGIHLLAGRLFDRRVALPGSPAQAIVNEAFVERFFHGGNAIGQYVASGRRYTKPQYEIVGVVSNAQYRSLREPVPPIIYDCLCGATDYPDIFILHVRTKGDPHHAISGVKGVLRSLDPELPVFNVKTLNEEVKRSLWRERFLTSLALFFTIISIVVGVIGLYGVMGTFVTSRSREIAVRVAMGATRRSVVLLMLLRAVQILAPGVAGGLLISLVMSRVLESIVFGVSVMDPTTILLTIIVLTAAGVGAAAFPILRALSLDPAVLLKQDA